MRIQLETIRILPEVVAASVKPIEKLDGMKVINVSGLTNGANGNGNGKGGFTGDLRNQLLGYRAQAPVVDGIIQSLGLGETLPDVIQNATGGVKKDEKESNGKKAALKKEPAVETTES